MPAMFKSIQIAFWMHLIFILSQFITTSSQNTVIWSDSCDTKDHWGVGGSVSKSPNCFSIYCIIISPSVGNLITESISTVLNTIPPGSESILGLTYDIKTYFGTYPDPTDEITVSYSIDNKVSWTNLKTYDNNVVTLSAESLMLPSECINQPNLYIKFASTGTDSTDMAYIDNVSLMVSIYTKTPTTNTPTTNNPTTTMPTTNNPTTNIPTTNGPTTNSPTTNSPITNNPTTNGPTTNSPTTNSPTTNSPTTNNPTTNNPTTNNPTTNNPTTNNPTTNNPTTNNPTHSSLQTSHSTVTTNMATPNENNAVGEVRETVVTSGNTHDSYANVNGKVGFAGLTDDPFDMMMFIVGASVLGLCMVLVCCFVFVRKYRNKHKAPDNEVHMTENTLYFGDNMSNDPENKTVTMVPPPPNKNVALQSEGDGLKYEGDVTSNKNSLYGFTKQNKNKVNNNYTMSAQGMNTNGYPNQTNRMPDLPAIPQPPQIIIRNDAIMATNNENRLGVQCDLESEDSALTTTVETGMDMSPIGFETPVGVVDTLTVMIQNHNNETDRGDNLEFIQENEIENNNNEDNECYDDDDEVINDMVTDGNKYIPPVPDKPLPSLNGMENGTSDSENNLEEESKSFEMITPVPEDNNV